MPTAATQVSNCETSKKSGRQRVNCVLADKLQEKGWSVQAAAQYLGVSRQRLYSVFANSERARLWECAISGMPAFNADMRLNTPQARKKRARKPHDTLPFSVGDTVVCDKYAGIADDGDEGKITSIRTSTQGLEVEVSMPGGVDCFPLAQFHAYFLTTGR